MAFNGSGATTGAISGAGIGSAFGPWGAAAGGLIGGIGGGFLSPKEKKEKIKQQPLLTPSQMQLQEQATQAGMNRGAGGAFGESADYYRDLLSNDSADYNAFQAPEMRKFNEEIIPGLSEQFAGMGSGGLSSSGFRNAAVNAGTDLSERLGAIRANLRMQGAQGLQQAGQYGLQQQTENVRNTPQPSFSQNAAQGIGYAIPQLASAAADYYKNKPSQQMQQPINSANSARIF